jgi:hypothetical protein
LKKKLFQIFKNEKPILFLVILVFILGGYLVLKTTLSRVKGASATSTKVVVWIDNERLLLNATSTEPEKILAENNVVVWPEDKIETALILDPVADEGAGQKIIIKRAPVYYLEIDRKTIEIRSWNPGIAGLIQKSGVTVHAKDIIEPKTVTELLPGGVITVTRVNEEDIDTLEDVAFNTVYKASSSVAFGQKVVTQDGHKGQIKKTYHVVYQDGVEVSRWLKSTATTIQKQDKIITTGVITGKVTIGDYYDAHYGPYTTSFYRTGYSGRTLLVTNNANGKQVKVKIVDFGPTNGPIMDLATTAYKEIGGLVWQGNIPSVSVQLLD